MEFLSKIIPHTIKIIAGGACGYMYGTTGLGVGLLAGAILDYIINKPKKLPTGFKQSKLSSKDQIKDFIASTLLLAAAIVKSDGYMNDLEEGYLSRFLSEQFGDNNSVEYLALLKSFVSNDFDLAATCANICSVNSYETRLQMIYIIVGVANSDFNMEDSEVLRIKKIAEYLQIDKWDFKSILAMYKNELTGSYQILELLPSASDVNVKKNYTMMAVKYHPDKLSHLGVLAVNTAQLKYNKVQEAYDSIKKERGFK